MRKNMSKTHQSEHDKIYNRWNDIKKRLDKTPVPPKFGAGEVWWCSVGRNVGVEIYGKGKYFLRPIFIFKKNNRLSFMGIPITSQRHDGSQYVPFELRGRYESAVISQAKTTSALRLHHRIGEVDEETFRKILTAFSDFYTKNILPQPKQRESRVVRRRHPRRICKFISHIHKLIISHLAKKVK